MKILRTSSEVILYHGSSVIFSEGCRFSQQQFAYGECSPPKYFVYLSKNIDGASKAAYKAVQATLNRQVRSTPLTPFPFPRHLQQIPIECIYRVTLYPKQRVADHSIKTPSQRMRGKLCLALLIIIKKHGSSLKALKFTLHRIPRLMWNGKKDDFTKALRELDSIMPKSKTGLSKTVYLYEIAGFPIVMNIEGDGDGQNYGTVYSMIGHLSKYNLELLRPITV